MLPVESAIDKVVTENPKPENIKDGDLWATHSGIMNFDGIKLRCHILSDGRRIFEAEDIENLFNHFENE